MTYFFLLWWPDLKLVYIHLPSSAAAFHCQYLVEHFLLFFLEFHQSRPVVHDCRSTEKKNKLVALSRTHETSLKPVNDKTSDQYFNGKKLVGFV